MSDPTDLHARLRAAIQEKLDLAKVATPGPWEHVDYSDPSGQPLTKDGRQSTYMGCGSVITIGEGVMGGWIAAPNGDLYPRSGYSPREDMAFIAAHNPAAMVRLHEAALRVLERHTHKPPNAYCGGDIYVGQPCDDVRDLADAYGVPVDAEETS